MQDGIWQKKTRPDGRVLWRNAITGHEVIKEPRPTLGGILADVMGLGKTLTILSLIIGSKSQASDFANMKPPEDDHDVVTQSKATLLVCPLSTIVNWEDQIKAHVKPKGLKYKVYQGSSRTNDAKKLKDYDLVITTYQMVGNEFSRDYRNRPNKPLFEINWFRVVLDEGERREASRINTND